MTFRTPKFLKNPLCLDRVYRKVFFRIYTTLVRYEMKSMVKYSKYTPIQIILGQFNLKVTPFPEGVVLLFKKPFLQSVVGFFPIQCNCYSIVHHLYILHEVSRDNNTVLYNYTLLKNPNIGTIHWLKNSALSRQTMCIKEHLTSNKNRCIYTVREFKRMTKSVVYRQGFYIRVYRIKQSLVYSRLYCRKDVCHCQQYVVVQILLCLSHVYIIFLDIILFWI